MCFVAVYFIIGILIGCIFNFIVFVDKEDIDYKKCIRYPFSFLFFFLTTITNNELLLFTIILMMALWPLFLLVLTIALIFFLIYLAFEHLALEKIKRFITIDINKIKK